MIRKAKPSDLKTIKQLTEACARAMEKNGIFQWNEQYPSLEKLQSDIDSGELYLMNEHQRIHGIVALTEKMDDEYVPVKWLTANTNNLYIHRLAVHPSVWGKGIGQSLMDFAENYAEKDRYSSIRLDTFGENQRNQRFYEKRNYERLGSIYFPKQSAHPFFCYEKILSGTRLNFLEQNGK